MPQQQHSQALRLGHIFGVKGDVKDNIHYVEESELVYPAGRSVVSYNTEKKIQRFLSPCAVDPSGGSGASSFTSQITALAFATSSKTRYLAVAESGDRAQIHIYDIATHKKKLKIPLTCQEMASKEIISMSFSPDGKQLLAQGGAPDWLLVNFLWEKSKPLQMAQVSNQTGASVYQCSYCPMDPTCVCVTGHGILRFLRLEQSEFKSIQFSIGKREPQNYLCHAWLDDRVLVGTDNGDILVFENGDFHGVLPSSPSDSKSIDSIATYSKGFVCGCDEGVLHVFERDEKEIYKRSKSFQIDGNLVRIRNLAISPSEDNVVCTLDNNQAFVFSLSNTDILKAEDMNFEPLSMSFHVGAITGLDVCVRKPLLVTCGADKSVRVWNYLERCVDVVKYFKDEPLAVAFHPSGLHLLVSFSDSLCFLNLLMDEMRIFREFAVKSCREVRFSNGGQYFAAANGTVVQLFSTYSCDVIGNLRGHKAKLRSLYWASDDAALVSADMDGQMYEWKLRDGIHVQEYSAGRVDITSAVTTHEGLALVAASDQSLRLIENSKEKFKIDCGVFLTQLALPGIPQNYLFGGTEAGSVRVYDLPLSGQFAEFECHSAPITRLRVSPDENFLFTVSEDGALAIFELDQRDLKNVARHRHEFALPWAEEILVTKSDLEKKMMMVQELRNKVEELQHHNQMQLRLRENNYQERLKDITTKFNHELEADKDRYQGLETSKAEMERRYKNTLTEMETRHRSKLAQLEQYHTQKMKSEELRLQSLEGSLKHNREKWNEQRKNKEEVYDQETKEHEREYQRALEKESAVRGSVAAEKDALTSDFEETKNLMETDADQDLEELKASYDAKLSNEKMNTLRLQEENAILKKKFSSLNDDIKEQKENIKKRENKQRSLYDQIRNLEKDVEGHMKEIQERESTIADKIKRIFELRKKNQELEKFKFVLDYKIKELKRQIAPRQAEIRDMGDQIGQMNNELASYKKDNAYLLLHVKELRLKLHGLEQEIQDQTARKKAVSAALRRLRSEIGSVHQQLDNHKLLKETIKTLYNDITISSEYTTAALHDAAIAAESKDDAVSEEVAGINSEHADAHAVYQRQRNYLERSIDSLKNKLEKELLVYRKDRARITQENIALIGEINVLRREIQMVRSSQQARDREQFNKRKMEKKQNAHSPRDGADAKWQGSFELVAPSLRSPKSARTAQPYRLSLTAPPTAATSPTAVMKKLSDPKKEKLRLQIAMQQEQIVALRSQLNTMYSLGPAPGGIVGIAGAHAPQHSGSPRNIWTATGVSLRSASAVNSTNGRHLFNDSHRLLQFHHRPVTADHPRRPQPPRIDSSFTLRQAANETALASPTSQDETVVIEAA